MAPGVPYEYATGAHSVGHPGTMNEVPMAPLPAPSLPQQPEPKPQQPSQAAFLQQWQHLIQPKLTQLLAQLGTQDVAKSLALAQIITYLPVLVEQKQLLKAEPLCLLGNPALQDFHVACCHQGLPLNQLGPMGKVWESGVVQVVQHSGNLPSDVHPLNLLTPALASATVDEIIYLPVYDATPNSTVQGVVAVVELMVSLRSTDVMVVANLISTVSAIMGSLGFALSNPAQQVPPAAGGKSIGRKSAPPDVGMRGQTSFEANNQAWLSPNGSRTFGSGGGLARTPSVRTLGKYNTPQ